MYTSHTLVYSSVFPFYVDIILHLYLLSVARDSLKQNLLVMDFWGERGTGNPRDQCGMRLL